MKNKLLLLSAIVILIAGAGTAQIKNLYNFTDNEQPYGSLTQSGNLFYGMTNEGGDSGRNEGYIFSINRNGTGFKQIWNFYDSGTIAFHANGARPDGSLIVSGNKLYGMTSGGGANYRGVVFSINTDGSGYKDLWDFNDTTNYIGNSTGEYPLGALLLLRGRLYGMTQLGGYGNDGLIFSIDTAGGGFKDILDFSQTANGVLPYGSLTLSGGKFFGTTIGGNCEDCRTLTSGYGYGNVFSIDTDGTHYKDVYVFAGVNGRDPSGDLTLSQDGTRLYGTTYTGGPLGSGSYGVIFGVDTNGADFRVLHNFNDTDGAYTETTLTLSGKTLYGTANEGGTFLAYSHGSGYGTIYSLDTTGNDFNVIYDFNLSNGSGPWGKLALVGDSLYGMTSQGGFDGSGEIFGCVLPPVTTGIQNISYTNGVSVYPNPTSGQFTVSIKNSEAGTTNQVEVYNVMGQEVYSQSNIQNPTFNIDLSSQASGVYMYRIFTLDGNAIGEGKIIIQK